MLNVRFSGRIQKDLRLLEKRGYDMDKFVLTVQVLAENNDIPKQLRDHPLKGDWAGYRECHITPDWLLIYKIEDDLLILTLTRTGTHSDLFKK